MEDLIQKRGGVGKVTVLVDSDIDVRDPELLIWALSFRTSRVTDFCFIGTGGGGLDPSAAPTGSSKGKMGTDVGEDYGRLVINATRKWAYPPVALPRKDYMERALEIWAKHPDLPAPQLRQPWHGYTLGFWPEDHQRYADLITQGEYLKIGDEMAELRERVREDMITPVRLDGR
jgi:4-hydroxy-3-polyprenylbenzoate decarboxylase